MSKQGIYLGKAGEAQAADFLQKRGYRIILKNYKTTLGQIDIIAEDKDTTCFIEVKTRSSDKFGLPKEALSFHKQMQISKAALVFLKEKNLFDKKARFDVVCVTYEDAIPKFDLIKNAFELPVKFTY